MNGTVLKEEYAYLTKYNKGSGYHSNLFVISGTTKNRNKEFFFDARQKTVDLVGLPALVDMADVNGEINFLWRITHDPNPDLAKEILLEYELGTSIEIGGQIEYIDRVIKRVFDILNNPQHQLHSDIDVFVREEFLDKIQPRRTLKITDICEYRDRPTVRELNKVYELARKVA